MLCPLHNINNRNITVHFTPNFLVVKNLNDNCPKKGIAEKSFHDNTERIFAVISLKDSHTIKKFSKLFTHSPDILTVVWLGTIFTTHRLPPVCTTLVIAK